VTVRADAESAVIEVRDAGRGMDSKRADRVFERFFRVDAARTRDRGGSGLGLAIVRAVTEAHGGAVSVATAPGEGFAVTLRIPIHVGPVGTEGSAPAAEPVVAPPG
jgi:two-component system, OmpR family, sensor kinase